MDERIEHLSCDVIIVGCGVAGLYCALNLPRELSIIMLAKTTLDECDSMLAQGGICVQHDTNDYMSFFEDTLRAGHFENRRESVDLMIRASRSVIDNLVSFGIDFAQNDDGTLRYTREGAHSRARICYHQDTTGAEITTKLLAAVKQLDEAMWEDGKKYYYSLREHYNDTLMKAEYDVELAALFVFINKHCFNGLYRVNGKGLFNVPYNNSRRTSVDESIIMEVSRYLQGITIMDGDFEEACEGAGQGDFVFIDSPYAPLNPTSFESYTKEGFDIESHRRLSNLFDKLTNRGCYCMLTNHNTELINELYSGKGYRRDVVSVKRMINSDASKRVGEEIIICNY